jgi:peptidoglycan/xylan/chitin deacetylase (PgdA/CDA1 family)
MIAQDGYLIGNHSMTHPDPGLTTLTDAQVTAEVQGAQQAILRANGADARPLFRFPYGDVNSRVLGDVNGLGYVAVRWTVDSLGWEGTSGGQSVQAVTNRVLTGHGTAIISNQEQNETIIKLAYPSGKIIWSFGHPGHAGTAPGYLHEPDDASRSRHGRMAGRSALGPGSCFR